MIAQQQIDLAMRAGWNVGPASAPQLARRASEQRQERLVEPAQAAEARGEGDLGHRQVRLVDQLLGEEHTAGLRDRDRRGAEMLAEQAPQLPLSHAEPYRQGLDIGLVEGAELDERECARHGIRRAAPRAEIRRRLRTAAQAGAEPRLLRGGGRRKEGHVLRKRRPRRADRATIDARGFDAGEDAAVEAGVAVAERAIAGVVIEIHGRTVIALPACV